MLISQDLLRTFVVTADAPTFGDAARSLHVTKSAVSQQIKNLEAQLGMPLFERVGRYARPTEAGAALAGVLRERLAAVDDALDALVSSSHKVAGEIRIGAPRPFASVYLRPRLAQLLRDHVELTSTVVFGTPTELEAALVARALDLTFLVRAPEHPSVAAALVFTEHFDAYASPGYLRAHGVSETAADLARHRFIVFDDDLPMHAPFWRMTFGARTPFRGTIVCRVASLEEMLALAEAGIGIAVLPEWFVAGAIARKGIARALQPARREPAHGGRRAANRIYLAWRRSAVETARLRVAREALLAGAPSS